MPLEELIDGNVLNQVHNVAVHLGTGVAASAATYGITRYLNGSDRYGLGLLTTAAVGSIAALVGPHLFGDAISTYLHAQTVGGVLLGAAGATVAPTAAGFFAGGHFGGDGSGNDSSLISAFQWGLVGLVGGAGTYLASELLRLGM